jgi:hypothetical protein
MSYNNTRSTHPRGNRPHRPRHETRKIDVNHVCDHLSWLFKSATQGQGRAVRGNKLHQWQVDFAYYVDNIQRGPSYIVPKIIAECNEFLDKISQETGRGKPSNS